METLSGDEIDDLLTRCGVGVLALFDGTYPYAIPMSFGYDGTEPIFSIQLGAAEQSHKQECLDGDSTACFTVYDEPEPGTWESAIITGTLVKFPEADVEAAFAALADNAEFPADVGVWGVPLSDVDLTLYGLDIDERTGRKFSPGR
ncbi:pyridoxamine 5'-phosphate oxidase family protein [Salinibaculum rarum]|uniref:pyridoxamine 5'-phosphate oxidase family protein n=1 Tax=Salinibaculum rarum TaxID=3058903 RepID=UPI00265F572F|nr:pyridoxamine 5'-phosphate oxidase family protein [Salinibaculum sp. KK48]